MKGLLAPSLLVLSALAQNAPHIRDWKPPAGESPARPRGACGDLRALTGYELTIITAVSHAATAEAPEFCRVTGQVLPEVRFEVSLPSAWNRRLYMFGNGGFAGENLEAPNRIGNRNRALQHGFAVAQTNTGHDAVEEPNGAFARNPQKLADFAFRSLHVTAETAKKLAAAHYGSAPARSYFMGCSTGGRQALILAQRFPQDFDGIVAGAPALNGTQVRLRSVATAKALAAGPIPTAKLKLLSDAVYRYCDPKDGATDGLIEDPRRCDFKPREHLQVCAGADGAGCFTEAQMRTLEAIYGEVVSQGKRLAPGWPVGAEIGAGPEGRSGWDGWILRDGGQTSTSATLAQGFFRNMPTALRDPNYQLTQFDFDRDPPKLDAVGQMMNATDPDLTAFRARGGKLFMYFGWADQALNPLMGVEYYEEVLRRMGAGTRDFFRLYMLPGVFHCAGGVGCASFDPLAAVVRWVEQGAAPEGLVAARVEAGKTVRTRPLCPYPQVARYKGSGSLDEAANFACVAQ